MNSILKKSGYNVRGIRDIAFNEMKFVISLPEQDPVTGLIMIYTSEVTKKP